MEVTLLNHVRLLPPQDVADREWLADLWQREWGGTTMVSKGKVHHLADLSALIAWDGETRTGATTFRLDETGCELLSINATTEGRGIGTALLEGGRSGCPCGALQPGLADHLER